MKHTRTDANYPILTKQVKLQHKNKPVLNLQSTKGVDFEQTFMKFTVIFSKIISFLEKKTIVETILVAITDSSICVVLTCI